MSVNQVCSLCCTTCSEYKSLQTNLDEPSEIYDITARYFDPMLLTQDEITNSHHIPILCRDCWFNINEFHEFQQKVLKTRMPFEDKSNLKAFPIEVKQEDANQANVHTSNAPDKHGVEKREDILFEHNLRDGDLNTEPITSCDKTLESILNQDEEENTANVDLKTKSLTGCGKTFVSSLKQEVIQGNLPISNTPDKDSLDKSEDDYENLFEHNLGDGDLNTEFLPSCRDTFESIPTQEVIQANVPTANASNNGSLDKTRDNEENLFEYNFEYGDLKTESPTSCEYNLESKLSPDVIQTNVPTSIKSENESSDISEDDEDNVLKHSLDHGDSETEPSTSCEDPLESKRSDKNDDENSSSLEEDNNNDEHNLTTERKFRQGTKSKKATKPSERIKKPKLRKRTKTKENISFNMKRARELDAIIAEWKSELKCDLCIETATNFDKLRSHFKEKHKTRFYVKCCERTFYHRCVLVQHIQLHLNPQTFKCDICGKSTTNKYNFKLHKKVMHEDAKQLKCNICEKIFKKNGNLERHLLRHSTNSKNFICSACGKGYVTEKLLKVHMKDVHNNDHVCDQCDETIHGSQAFKNHLMEHAGIERPNFPCDVCGNKLKTSYSLKRHKNVYHNDDSTIYVCGVCGKVFPNRLSLMRHKKSIHETERKHKCTFCDKAFKQPRLLREHITIHTGEYLHQCPNCPQKFKVSSNLYHHRKRKHPVEWEEARKNRPQCPTTNNDQVKKHIAIY